MNTYVYYIGKKIYINVTNRCSNSCDFCIRKGHDGMGNQPLWIDREPNSEDVIEQLPTNLNDYDKEVVFCGFGEPTFNMDVVSNVGEFLRCCNKTVRINTNGQGNLINNRDIVSELVDCVDVVNVSLNMSNAVSYQKVCHSSYGEIAFDQLLSFADSCKHYGIETIFSVVDCIGEKEVEACKIVAKKHGIKLRVRKFE